jgi:hypothetical protein
MHVGWPAIVNGILWVYVCYGLLIDFVVIIIVEVVEIQISV